MVIHCHFYTHKTQEIYVIFHVRTDFTDKLWCNLWVLETNVFPMS